MAKRNKLLRQNGNLSVIIVLISLVDLLALYYFKYKNQGIPFSDFNIAYIGNMLNLLFACILVIGLILYTFLTKHGYKRGLLVTFTVILNLILLFAIIASKIRLPLPNVYFMDHPIHKIFIGVMFSLYQFIQIIFISLLWYSVIGRELVVLRSIVNSIVIVALLLVLTFVFINIKKNNVKNSTDIRGKVNVAVVLGAAVWPHNAPSPSLAARADKAVELYNEGIVQKIQLTGSNAPGEMSEAEVAFNYLKSEGVNSADVWLEHKSVSTLEQIRFIRDSLLTKNNIGRVIIVSDSYHLTRVREMCKFYKVNARFAASNLKLSFDHNLYYKMKESVALLVFWFFAL